MKKNLPGGKLVIVIDELDRCRPTFAIDTLEILKHIMDVQNVVYVLALDVRQLGAAIKQVYGADTDATEYLMRFFSYYSRMPKVGTKHLIYNIFEAAGVELEHDAKDALTAIAEKLVLTARDLETIGKVYQIMLDAFLRQYKNQQAYILYWILVCMKYKKPIAFQELFSVRNRDNELIAILKDVCIIGAGEKVLQNYPMKDLDFYRGNRRESDQEAEFQIVGFQEKEGAIRIELKKKRGYVTYMMGADEGISLSGLLFLPDVLRWEEIKHLTPGEFLLQQMEMYNFIPEIE